MHKTHRVFFFLGLLFVFAFFFVFLVYELKYHVYIPKPPVVNYRIAASDSTNYPNTFIYDLENGNANSMFSTLHAFSGKRSVKISGKDQYSVLLQKPFAEFNYKNLSEARFGAWIYLPANANKWEGKLVFQIVSSGNSLKYSKLINIDDDAPKQDAWFYVSGKAEIKDVKFDSTDIVKVYYWNNCKREVFMDDVLLVLGKQELKGNKPLIDETVKNYSYKPVPNQPPYPAYYAEKQIVVNVKNTSVMSTDGNGSFELDRNDRFLAGHFFNTRNATDQILILRKGIPFGYIWYDAANHQFNYKKLSFKNDIKFAKPPVQMTVADVDGDGVDEIVAFDASPQNLLWFKPAQNPASMQVYLQRTGDIGLKAAITQISKFHPKGNKKEELIAIEATGKTNLLSFDKKKWNTVSLGEITEANTQRYESKMLGADFINSGGADNILLLYSDIKSRQCYYKLFDVDVVLKKISCIQQGNFNGKCDTLYPQNTYFANDFDGDGKAELISCGNSWRFDMKLIRFSEKSYQILGNIDFKGYEKDHNPKYYENLIVSAGKFADNNTVSFFTLCSNNSIIVDLPETIGLYSFLTLQHDPKK